MTQTDCFTTNTTAWVSSEYREILRDLRGFLTRKFASLRDAASHLGRSHNFLNSVLSGRTQLKLPTLLRILHAGGSSLPVLRSETRYHSTDPLKILRHVSNGHPESPPWLAPCLDQLLSDSASDPRKDHVFEYADREVKLYSCPWQLERELDDDLSILTRSRSNSIRSSSLLRLSLLWTRAASRGTPGHAGVLGVFEAVDSCLAQVRSLAWMRPEVFLALADCVAQVNPTATRAITREVVHSAVVQDHFLPLAGALLLDAEIALLQKDTELADRILRSLVRNLRSAQLSDLPIGSESDPSMPALKALLEQSHSFYSRLLIFSSWRYWMKRDFSRARSELARLRAATAAGTICPSVFEALAAWLEAAIARAVGQLPEMERHLARAAALDVGSRPARAGLAHLRRLSYFWTSGQRSRFQTTIHQHLGSLADRLPPSVADDLLRCRARYSRGTFHQDDLLPIEYQLEKAVSEPTPWSLAD